MLVQDLMDLFTWGKMARGEHREGVHDPLLFGLLFRHIYYCKTNQFRN